VSGARFVVGYFLSAVAAMVALIVVLFGLCFWIPLRWLSNEQRRDYKRARGDPGDC